MRIIEASGPDGQVDGTDLEEFIHVAFMVGEVPEKQIRRDVREQAKHKKDTSTDVTDGSNPGTQVHTCGPSGRSIAC